MVWMINEAAFLARSTHHGSSMAMMMMLLMNPYIEASSTLVFTPSWSDLTSGSEVGS